jgi:hypothetical protein
MSAFAASFLANPFEAQALGGTTDQNGNIFNANGDHVGVVPGSVADIGSKGAVVTPTSTSSTPAAGSGSTGGSGATPTSSGTGSAIWANVLDFARKATGIDTIENMVFILVGLILIAAGVFSFKPARDVVMGVAKGAVAP